MCTHLNSGGTGSAVDQCQFPKATGLTDTTQELLVDINLGKKREGGKEGVREGID